MEMQNYVVFATIAMGSATELEYHLLLARDLNFIQASEYESLVENLVEVKRISLKS